MRSDSRSRQLLEIDGDRYYLDPRGRGEYLIPEHVAEHLAAQTPTAADARPGQVAEYEVEWVQGQRREKRRETCVLEGCGLPLPPGATRFCGPVHAHRYAQRAYSRRKRGIERWVTLRGSSAYRFVRPFPKSLRTARRLFVEHICEDVCQYRGDDGLCPSVGNPSCDSARPRCLLYAVYADDLLLWTARHQGVPVERRYTTNDGYWKDASSEGRSPQLPLVEPPARPPEAPGSAD